MYEYQATIVRWLDGDTCEVDVDLGFCISARKRVRLYGINAPETHSPSLDERKAAAAALKAMLEVAPPGLKVEIRSFKPGQDGGEGDDKYGRWLAVIRTPLHGDVADYLVSCGYAQRYFGGKREPWEPPKPA